MMSYMHTFWNDSYYKGRNVRLCIPFYELCQEDRARKNGTHKRKLLPLICRIYSDV